MAQFPPKNEIVNDWLPRYTGMIVEDDRGITRDSSSRGYLGEVRVIGKRVKAVAG